MPCNPFVSVRKPCLLLQIGASNELPESEELDALYDRFLVRRSVSQVSSAQLGNLARLAARQGASNPGAGPAGEPSGNGAPAVEGAEGTSGLDLEDFRWAPVHAVTLLRLQRERWFLESTRWALG